MRSGMPKFEMHVHLNWGEQKSLMHSASLRADIGKVACSCICESQYEDWSREGDDCRFLAKQEFDESSCSALENRFRHPLE